MSGRWGQNYDSKEYWEERYGSAAKEQTYFDWYLITFTRIEPLVRAYVTEKIGLAIDVGCGNSNISQEIYASGLFGSVIGIDYSENVINLQNNGLNNAQCPGLSFQCANVTAMGSTLEEGSVDVIFDKATMDALDCGEDQTNSIAAAKEYGRVLNTVHGLCFIITCRDPTRRLDSFDKNGPLVPLEICELRKPEGDNSPDRVHVLVFTTAGSIHEKPIPPVRSTLDTMGTLVRT
eukprot:Clim_evm51s202 gene=Clim_evmTU51s202